MRRLLKVPIALGLSALASAVLAPDARAQSFNYFTTGFFSSPGTACNQTVAAPTASCTAAAPGGASGTLALTFAGTPVSPFGYLSGSQVQLGTFDPAGIGDFTIPSPSPVMFTLVINQVNPTTGMASTRGAITGRLARTTSGSFSSLVFSPSPQTVSIGPVDYSLIFDQGVNGIKIAADFPTTIKAVGTVRTVTPEPASVVLLGTGMLGLLGVIRRKSKSLV